MYIYSCELQPAAAATAVSEAVHVRAGQQPQPQQQQDIAASWQPSLRAQGTQAVTCRLRGRRWRLQQQSESRLAAAAPPQSERNRELTNSLSFSLSLSLFFSLSVFLSLSLSPSLLSGGGSGGSNAGRVHFRVQAACSSSKLRLLQQHIRSGRLRLLDSYSDSDNMTLTWTFQ